MLSHDQLAKHETNKTYCWNTHSSKRSRVEEDITEYSSTSKRRIQQQSNSKRRIQQQSSSTKRRHCMTIGVVFAAADLPPVHHYNSMTQNCGSCRVEYFHRLKPQVQCGTLEPGAAQNQRLKGSTGSDSSTLSHFHLLFVGL